MQELSQEEANRFRRVYCGLCHELNDRYGVVARFILNYDLTYLAVLLSNEQEGECLSARCLASPVHKRAYETSNDALTLAADESVILAYWQLRDGVEDHDWFHGLKYRGLSALLEPAYRKAAAARPVFDRSVQRQLQRLADLERANSPSMDAAADAFATLLANAAEGVDNPVRHRVLEQLLYHLGRWIYLIDAADDLKKDAENGNYNPVALRFGLVNGEWTEKARREFVATLDHSIHMMATAYELWDFGVWKPLLEATLYTGLFRVGKAVLDGTFHKSRREDRKNVEEST